MPDPTYSTVISETNEIDLVTVPDTVLGNTDAIVKQQITEIKSTLFTIGSVLSGLDNRLIEVESLVK